MRLVVRDLEKCISSGHQYALEKFDNLEVKEDGKE